MNPSETPFLPCGEFSTSPTWILPRPGMTLYQRWKPADFPFKNSIGGTPNYYKPESGTDKQAGGAGKNTVDTDTV